jgi:hypothetical protein
VKVNHRATEPTEGSKRAQRRQEEKRKKQNSRIAFGGRIGEARFISNMRNLFPKGEGTYS